MVTKLWMLSFLGICNGWMAPFINSYAWYELVLYLLSILGSSASLATVTCTRKYGGKNFREGNKDKYLTLLDRFILQLYFRSILLSMKSTYY